MPIDPNVLLRGIVPDAVGAASRGFDLGNAIRNAPLLRQQREQALAAGEQKAQSEKLKQGQNEALVAFQLFGNEPITQDNYSQAISLAAAQGLQIDDKERMPSPENISMFNQVVQAGGQLAQGSGRGGLASATTTTWKNGTTLFNLPNGSQRLVFQGREITDPAEIDRTIKAANKSGLIQAGQKEFTKAQQKALGAAKGGEEVLDITADIAEETAAATQRGKARIKLATDPEIAKSVAKARAEGVTEADDIERLSNLDANMTGLLDVVGNLKELGQKSTFTMKGRAFDAVTRELGFNVGEGANARAKFIAVIDNQILPLLKQTFGAAFTFPEGQSLKKTLGDPNASPSEKNAQLDAFIEGKFREAQAAREKLGIEAPAAADDVVVTELSDEELFR